jgi:hypothetical protein
MTTAELEKQIADILDLWACGSCEKVRDGIAKEIASLIEQNKPKPVDKYPDTEADGYVFCGKCGKMKEI